MLQQLDKVLQDADSSAFQHHPMLKIWYFEQMSTQSHEVAVFWCRVCDRYPGGRPNRVDGHHGRLLDVCGALVHAHHWCATFLVIPSKKSTSGRDWLKLTNWPVLKPSLIQLSQQLHAWHLRYAQRQCQKRPIGSYVCNLLYTCWKPMLMSIKSTARI